MKTIRSKMSKIPTLAKVGLSLALTLVILLLIADNRAITNAQPAAVVNPPIGTVMAYSGPINSAWENTNGWLVCDGRSLNRTNPQYSELFNKIGSSWGGDGVNQYNIPDLRGRFLRGVDGGTGRDPDASSRTASNAGGHVGNDVGSVQGDQLVHHKHQTEGYHLEASGGNGFDGAGFASNSAQNSSYRRRYDTLDDGGGNETRPKNAYVTWIIRYK